jgi:hypothetical protein
MQLVAIKAVRAVDAIDPWRPRVCHTALVGGPRPIEPSFPENPHPLKTGQGGRDRRRHGGLDFRLPNAEFADVEIDEQAGAVSPLAALTLPHEPSFPASSYLPKPASG